MALEQADAGVVAPASDAWVIDDDTSPDCGEGEKNGHESQGPRSELRDGFDELEDRKNGLELVSQSRGVDATRVLPGKIMVWQPMMKMICMGPNCLIPIFLRL